MAIQYRTPVSFSQYRTVRVFLSSTFRDMHEERDYLVKFVFPELRSRCRSRGLEFTEVDLRWGVTEEQAERGEVLPICLAEIEKCRPYFIGILGQRYGYVPAETHQELIAEQPWLDDYKERSITELEILHGALKTQEMASRSFFYFRDPAYLDKVPTESRRDYLPEDPDSEAKLVALKDRIRKSGHVVRERFTDPQVLGEMVLADLWEAITKEFPESGEPDRLDLLAAEHEAFARSRAHVYIGRQEYFDRLNTHAGDNALPLVILGEAGCGKSALFANWVLRYREEHPKDFVFFHFTGASPDSTDYVSMLSRLLAEIKRRYGFTEEVPADSDKLRDAVPIWLARAGAGDERIIIVLDGLNQLEDRDNALDLGWLPEHFPPQVRLIISTLPGRSLIEIERRNWQRLTVEALDTEERRHLVRDYLDQYRKALNDKRVEQITSSPQTANPLYLRALLDELRVFGIHEKLDERLAHYLRAQSTPDLYGLILERYEQDYEQDRPGLVRDTMSFIWASRLGLPESEVTVLLGTLDRPLPKVLWSPLYLAAEQNIVNRSGLLGFSHAFLRQAVEHRYLLMPEAKRRVHRTLAQHFIGLQMGERKVAELPWQFYAAGDYEKLKGCLTEPQLLVAAVNNGRLSDLGMYWMCLKSDHDPVPTYVNAAKQLKGRSEDNKIYPVYVDAVGQVLEYLGFYEDAENFYGERLRTEIQLDRATWIFVAVNRLVRVLIKQNKFKEAMKWQSEFYELGKYQEPGEYARGSIDYLIMLAGLYAEHGYFEEADETLGIAETRANEVSNLSAATKGLLLLTQAKLAILSYEHVPIWDADSQDNLATEEKPEAIALRAVDFMRRDFGPRHPDFGMALRNLTQAYLLSKDNKKALEAATEAVACSELVFGNEHTETAKSIICLADVHFEEGQLERAETLYKKGLDIFQINNTDTIDYARGLNRLAAVYRIKGKDTEVSLLENILDHLHKSSAVKLGSLITGQYEAMTGAPSARLSRSIKSVSIQTTKKIIPAIESFINRMGQNLAKIIFSLFCVGLFTGMALFAFGPFARFVAAHGDPGLMKLIGFGFGHLIFIGSLMAGYSECFKVVLGNPKDGTSQHFLGKILAYLSYAGSFFLLRDYLHLIPKEATSVVVIILGIIILIPSLIGMVSQKSASKLLENIGVGFDLMLPKVVLVASALYKIGPRALSLSKTELVDVISGNKEDASLNMDNELPDGLSVYEKSNPHVDEEFTPAEAKDRKYQPERWPAVLAGLVAPLLLLVPRFFELLPVGLHPEEKTATWYAALLLILFYMFLGNRMGRKSTPLRRTLLIALILTVVVSLMILLVQGKLTQTDMMDALDWNLKAYIFLLISYGVTKAFIRKISKIGISTAETGEVEKPAFSIVFAVVGGLFFPVIMLIIRMMIKLLGVAWTAPDWWAVTMVVLSGIAFIIYGIEMVRRRHSAFKTMVVQIPILFVATLGVQLILGIESGKILTVATAAAFVFGLVEIVSFGISNKIMHRRKKMSLH